DGGDTDLEPVRPSGILGHTATESAGRLAGRVGRVIETVGQNRLGQPRVHHSGLQHGPALNRVDLQYLIQPGQGDEYRVRIGQRAAGESGPSSEGHERHLHKIQTTYDL